MAEAERPLKKRRLDGDGPFKRRDRQAKPKPVKAGSSEDAIRFEKAALIGDRARETSPFAYLEEVELEVVGLSAHGDGLALSPEKDWVVAIPFCLPGEKVLTRIYRNADGHSYGDLVQVISENTTEDKDWPRDDSLIRCKYFGKCGGCQYQMLPYERQLLHKQSLVKNAFINSSGLDASILPDVRPTISSPKQYNYRTKITPHFEVPPKQLSLQERLEHLTIGFETKGRRKVLDIEECPIATETINTALVMERQKVKDNLQTYKRGATLLLRHSAPEGDDLDNDSKSEAGVCVTNHKHTVKEYVGGKVFEFNAGSFFQNNNGILEALLEYVAQQIAGLPPSASDDERYLVDAYCGSGLFAISLAASFTTVAGVEISADSVKWAKHNATLNSVTNATFIAGNAEAIFATIAFPADQTTVLIDPPRKGCDELFLEQLMAFKPKHILYVSCNVHTHARDVGVLVQKGGYKIDSIRGADLFPQTYHVEGVCVLSR